MTSLSPNAPGTLPRAFWMAMIANYLWINVSETFRYFAFVMPMMRKALSEVPHVAPMNLPVFLLWGLWDTILVVAVTGAAWVVMEQFGNALRIALMTATGLWITIFGILWIGMLNMNLTTLSVLGVALPLAWVELAGAVLIVRRARVAVKAGRR